MWRFNEYADNIAIVTETGIKITYRAIQEASKSLAAYVSDRCLVFNLCSNKVGSLLGYVSFINNHIVPLLLDSHLESVLLNCLIESYKPDYLWVPKNMQDEFSETAIVCSYYDYCLLKTKYVKMYPLNDNLALLLTTSGSTGSPKLVRQSYDNIRANTKSIVEYLELNETERAITTLPMSYTYGLSIINSHLYVGASIILTSKTVMQKEFWRQFKDYKATSFGGVPYTYEMLNRLRFFNMDLLYLRTMTQAGGKLSPDLHKKFAEYAIENGKHFIVMYGQTEATARMGYLPHEKSIDKCGSMGIAIPDGKFSLIDEDGKEIIEPDTIGELVYEGANVMLGYAECGPDLSKSDERNGVLITGDMAKKDADGFYYIVGRKKRFLKIYGSRINLDEIEKLIESQFSDFDCTCTGIDDTMYIFITDASQIDNVKHFIVEKTGFHHAAFRVKFIDAIPKNEAGKTLYKNLEKYYDCL